MGKSFRSFMREIEAEAEAEGPSAVLESRRLRTQYELAAKVLFTRMDRRMSQKDLARETGIDQAEISRIERGDANPTLLTVVRLLTALDLQVAFARTHRRPSRRAATRRIKPRIAARSRTRR